MSCILGSDLQWSIMIYWEGVIEKKQLSSGQVKIAGTKLNPSFISGRAM